MSKTLLISLLLLAPARAHVSTRGQAPAATPRPQSAVCPDPRTCREVIKRINQERKQELRPYEARLQELEGGGAGTKARRGSEARRRADPAVGAAPPPAATPIPVSSPLTPDDVLAELRAALDRPEKPVDVQTERDGNIQIVKALSIGVLKLEYDKDVKAGRAFTLKVSITPSDVVEESLLGRLTHAPVTFYVEPSYKFARSDAVYDETQSGGKVLREFNAQDMTWIWKVTPHEDFETDKTDLILRAQAKIGTRATDWRVVSRSEIEIKESGLKSWVVNNQPLIAALLTLFTTALPLGLTLRIRGRKFRELRKELKSQQALVAEQKAWLQTKDKISSELSRANSKLRSEYKEAAGKWERLERRASGYEVMASKIAGCAGPALLIRPLRDAKARPWRRVAVTCSPRRHGRAQPRTAADWLRRILR